jgi:prolyl-tRNA editing enzyme YbaK/EbsC (Cys-tRNA(Pro) deacylase)
MWSTSTPRATRHISHAPVVTCEDAAAARGIGLSEELKTLLLESGRLRIAVHLRGDARLRLRTIKRLLRLRDVRFIETPVLASAGLRAGTINPWNVPFCRYHVLCLHVLTNTEMATNAGALDAGQFFPTAALLDLPNLLVGFLGEFSD